MRGVAWDYCTVQYCTIGQYMYCYLVVLSSGRDQDIRTEHWPAAASCLLLRDEGARADEQNCRRRLHEAAPYGNGRDRQTLRGRGTARRGHEH